MDLETIGQSLTTGLGDKEQISVNRDVRNILVQACLKEGIASDPKMLAAVKGLMADNDRSALNQLRLAMEERQGEDRNELLRSLFMKIAEEGQTGMLGPRPVIEGERPKQIEDLGEEEFTFHPAEGTIGNDTEQSVI